MKKIRMNTIVYIAVALCLALLMLPGLAYADDTDAGDPEGGSVVSDVISREVNTSQTQEVKSYMKEPEGLSQQDAVEQDGNDLPFAAEQNKYGSVSVTDERGGDGSEGGSILENEQNFNDDYESKSGEPPEEGWVTDENGTYYYKDGEKLTGWQTIDSYRYYFAPETGVMLTGWQIIDGRRYYFSSKGVMLRGLRTIDGNLYYLNNYVMTGARKIGSKVYYFESNGMARMTKGWFSDKTRFALGDGRIANSVCLISNRYYLFNSTTGLRIGENK